MTELNPRPPLRTNNNVVKGKKVARNKQISHQG